MKRNFVKTFPTCSKILPKTASITVGKSSLTGFRSLIKLVIFKPQPDSLNIEEAIKFSQGPSSLNSFDSTPINEHLFDGDLPVEKSNPSNSTVVEVY